MPAQGDDLLRLAERAVGQGADVVGMAGGDGSQALVSSVAMRHNMGFVCVPAGDRVLVNTPPWGCTPRSCSHLPTRTARSARPSTCSRRCSARTRCRRYELGRAEGFGSRRRIDAGTLGTVAATFQSSKDAAKLAQQQAAAGGADVLGMAGGDGSQALVATVAARHNLGFVCVPAGTRNHLAMDLGLDRENVAEALDAFGEAVERRIDLGLVGERVFVNNATVGLYAKIVQSPAYRAHKVGTALELLPSMLGPDATPFDLRFTGPDGTEHASAHLILVSNDRYELGSGEGFGSRRRIDAGNLGIVAATFRTSGEIARLLESEAAGRSWRPPGWVEWAGTSFSLHSSQPLEIGIDGEALVLDPPIEFRTLPGALRVRIPLGAPGYSPAAAAPTKGWATLLALLRTAAGQPVAIDAS